MKDKTKKILSVTFLIVIIGLFVYYIYTHIGDFKQLTITNPLYLIPLILITLIFSVTNGLITKYLLEPFKITLKFKEWFGLSLVTSFYNMITPLKGGMAARAIYLKKKHNFAYTQFLATLSGIYVITFLIAAFVGLISLALLYFNRGIFNWLVTLIFLGAFIPLLIIVLFSPRFPETKSNFINRFIRVMNGWNLIRKNTKVISVVAIMNIIQLLLAAVMLMLSYRMFGVPLGFTESIFFAALGSLGVLIAITPGSLGIAEVITVFSGLIIGIQPYQSLAVAILTRAVGMVVVFSLGPIYSYLLMKNLDKKPQQI